jgi:hypothetical protein
MRSTIEFARFLRLANLPNFTLDRLSRYAATVWRQVGRAAAFDAFPSHIYIVDTARIGPDDENRIFEMGQ